MEVIVKRCKHCGCELTMANAWLYRRQYIRNECKPCKVALLREYSIKRKQLDTVAISSLPSNLRIFKDYLWLISQKIKLVFSKIRD